MGEARASGSEGVDYVVQKCLMIGVSDTAFGWAVAEGIVEGVDATTLKPAAITNRAQNAMILFHPGAGLFFEEQRPRQFV